MRQLLSALSGTSPDSISTKRLLAACAAVAALFFWVSSGQSQPLTLDLDGDGRLDQLVPDAVSPQGFFVAGAQGLSVPAPRVSSSTATPPSLIACDWNADGLPDVLTLRPGEPLSLWLNQGDRRFGRDDLFGEQIAIPWQSVAVADLANSPYPSLLGRTDSVTVVVVERRDARSFEWSYWRLPEAGRPTARDVDGDGRLDVIVGSYVRLRGGTGWSSQWTDRAAVPAGRTARLRLIGPPDNPNSVGARVTFLTPAGSQTHWLYPPYWKATDLSLELVLSNGALQATNGAHAGIIVRWPDGSYAMSARALEPGVYELRALAPSVDAVAEWTAADSRSHLRWHLTTPASPLTRAFWTAVRSGVVGDPQPVAFDETGQWIDWRSDRPLEPGESCILAYAGNPVSVRTVPASSVKLLPFPVARDSLPASDGLVVADGNGDGRKDLIYQRGAVDVGTFHLKAISPLIAGVSAPGRFVGDRPGHRVWAHVVRSALGKNPPNGGMRQTLTWAEGTPPERIRGWRLVVTDVTGDQRPDLVALSPEGVVEIYEGTDGRPSGRHLVRGEARIGPAGPRETANLALVNPTRQPVIITEAFVVDGPLRLGDVSLPARIGPGDTLRVSVSIPEREHESAFARLAIVSEQVDRNRTEIPVRVAIGVSPDAPFMRIPHDFGVVQRDSIARGSVRVPWVRLPAGLEAIGVVEDGDGQATVRAVQTDRDTVRLEIEFTALAVGNVAVTYPLLRGEVVLGATAVDTIPPPPPAPIVETMGDSVLVRWSPVEAADLDHYQVERFDDGEPRRWVVELDTSWLDTGLGEGQTRAYLVATVDVTDNRAASDIVSVTRPDETAPTITLVDPSPDARDVGLRQPVQIVIADSLTGIAPDGLRIWIGDNLIPTEYLRIRKERHRWEVTYQPRVWPMAARVLLTVSAADSAKPPNTRRWIGFFTTVADTFVPALRFLGAPPTLGEGGTVQAVLSLPSDRELVSADLIVRPAGRSVPQRLSGQVRGHRIEVDVPPALCPPSGFFYRWVFQTNRRTYEWPDDTARTWRSWQFRVSDEVSFWPRSGSPGVGRALFAAPVATDDGDALSLLRADLRHSPRRACLYGFDAERQKWVAQGELGPLGIGDAVVVTWNEAAPVVQTGAGQTVALDSAQTVTLFPRWNLVGQPFPYPVSWDRVRRANPDLPVSGLWVERDQLMLTDVWDAWEGAWVYLASARPTALIIPSGDTVLASDGRSVARAREAPPVWFATSDEVQAETQMLLVVSARSGSRAIGDISLGWHAQASDGYDALDIPAPPTPDSVLVLRFPHYDWQHNPGGYAVDVRKPARGGIWRLAVDTDGRSPVVLNFGFAVPPPPGVNAVVIDLMTQDSLRLGVPTTSYTLRDVARFPVRELAIVVGDDEFRQSLEREEALAPSTLHLFQNYPNPFNRETTITYSVPAESERDERLRIVIYNMLGQQVRVLHDGTASAGTHTVMWDALDDNGGSLSSGLYFCELTWGRERRFLRLIYLR